MVATAWLLTTISLVRFQVAEQSICVTNIPCIAQLVEQYLDKVWVIGSSPVAGTKSVAVSLGKAENVLSVRQVSSILTTVANQPQP